MLEKKGKRENNEQPELFSGAVAERALEPEIEKSTVKTFDNRQSVKKLKDFGSVSKFRMNFEK